MQLQKVLDRVSLTKASHYFLTSSGLFTNGHTVTFTGSAGAVVFTFVTALSSGPAVAGEIKIGTAAANLQHLLDVINNPYLETSANYTALSAANQAKFAGFKLSGSTTATVLTVLNPTFAPLTVAETLTNVAWSSYSYSAGLPLNTDLPSTLQFIAESISSGNGVFTVEVSNDNINWIAYSRLTSNATNTNVQTDTRVASGTLSSNTSAVFAIPDRFGFMRVKCVITTDGVYSAVVAN